MSASATLVAARESPEAADGSARSAWEVFSDHLQRRKQGEVEEDLERNYADDVVVLSGSGVYRGKEGVRRLAALLDEHLPGARYRFRTKLVEGEMAFLEWEGFSPSALVHDGTDTYRIRNGRIVFQTVHYTVEPAVGKGRKASHTAPQRRRGAQREERE